MTLRSASTFYTSTERLTRLKLLKCDFTYIQKFEPDVLQLVLQDLFIILSRFLAGSCSVKMSQAFHDPSNNFHRVWER